MGLTMASSLGEEAGMRGAGFNWRRRRRKKGTPGVGREMLGTKAHRELAKHAVSKGTKAVTKYTSSK